MPRPFDTFLNERNKTRGKKAFADPSTDIPAQYRILNLLAPDSRKSLAALQAESELDVMRFAGTIDSLVAANLIELEEGHGDQTAALTAVGAALMR